MQHSTPRASVDFDALNRAALAALPAILRRLLPDGRIVCESACNFDP